MEKAMDCLPSGVPCKLKISQRVGILAVLAEQSHKLIEFGTPTNRELLPASVGMSFYMWLMCCTGSFQIASWEMSRSQMMHFQGYNAAPHV